MNFELDEVVLLAVSDEALELAAGGAQGGPCAHPCDITFCTYACLWC